MLLVMICMFVPVLQYLCVLLNLLCVWSLVGVDLVILLFLGRNVMIMNLERVIFTLFESDLIGDMNSVQWGKILELFMLACF